MLAYVESWRSIPDGSATMDSIPQTGSGFIYGGEWAWQPRVWWYDNCIQLYEAGRNAIGRVDVSAGRVSGEYNWSDLSGLPLDGTAHQLFQQGTWGGANPIMVSFAQTAVNQAIIACALERYRVARKDYPESLEQLLPEYLESVPLDIVRGRPIVYQRVDGDSFILRGAGGNGMIEQSKKASDDWLWAFPMATNAPPGAAVNPR
jgi:hypothetical protein